MRSALSLCLATLLVFAAAGCGDDATEPAPVTIADLAGSWTATSVKLTNNADPSQQFDIVTAGGEVRFTLLTNGGFRTWVELGEIMDEWDALLTLSGNTATTTPAEASRPTRHYTFSLDGDVLTLNSSDAEWDFTLSGADPVPASESSVYLRQ